MDSNNTNKYFRNSLNTSLGNTNSGSCRNKNRTNYNSFHTSELDTSTNMNMSVYSYSLDTKRNCSYTTAMIALNTSNTCRPSHTHNN